MKAIYFPSQIAHLLANDKNLLKSFQGDQSFRLLGDCLLWASFYNT
jgi:hypothetical protein